MGSVMNKVIQLTGTLIGMERKETQTASP